MDEFNQQSPPREMNANAETTYQVSGNGRTESVGMAVISTVAARSDTDSAELDPLYAVVNPDALDALFQPGAVGQVAFTYSGYEVVVYSDGDIDVARADE